MNMQERQRKIVAEFSKFETWEDKYRHLIELGKALPEYPDKWRNEDHKVRGCQSQVWLHAELGPDQRLRFSGDSDALIVKGLVALLLRLYSEATTQEILGTSPEFVSELDLGTNLSPSRSNGLFAMVKQIKFYALAFQARANQA